jgi:hypothetical protein
LHENRRRRIRSSGIKQREMRWSRRERRERRERRRKRRKRRKSRRSFLHLHQTWVEESHVVSRPARQQQERQRGRWRIVWNG